MTSPSRTPFGDLLRQLRKRMGLSQRELAKLAKMSERGISDLERGISKSPHPENIKNIADALGLESPEREHFLSLRRRVTPLIASHGERQPPDFGSGSIPLIGRAYEQHLIDQLLDGDGAPMLLFFGEPGIGKSRLLDDTVARARAQGWTVLQGGSQQSDGQHPYAPLVQALKAHIAGLTPTEQRQLASDFEWLSRLVPELIDVAQAPMPSRQTSPKQERHLIFDAVVRYIARIANTGGVLLALDDLQWASPDGLSLLTAVLRSTTGWTRPYPLRIVGAAHDVRHNPNHPLPGALSDFERNQLASTKLLAPLEREDAVILLQAALADIGSLPQDLRDTVIQQALARAGGVPFFLMSFAREIRSNLHDGMLPLVGGGIPRDAAEMIRQWLRGLPDTARDVLAAAAVYGRAAPLRVLAAACDLSERQALAAVEAAYATQALHETDDGACAFEHDLIREAALADLSAARRQMLHRRIAEALESAPGPAKVELLAYHYGRSGNSDKAILYLERAGDWALEQRAHAAAEMFYRDALSHLAQLDIDAASGRVQEKLGSVLMGSGRYADALSALESAAISFRRIGDSDGIGRVVAQIGWAHVHSGTAHEGVRRVEPLLAQEVMAHLRITTQVALLRAHAVLQFALNQYTEQLASAERACQLARGANDTRALAQSMRLKGLALTLLGKFAEAVPVLHETIGLSEIVGDLDSFSAALNDAAAVYRTRGDLKSSWAYSARAVDVVTQLGDATGTAFLTSSHGEDAYLLGDWATARQCFERAVAVVRDMGASWVTAYPLENLGLLNLVEGHDEAAVSLLNEALTHAERDHDLQALRFAHAVLAERDLMHGQAKDALRRLLPLLGHSSAGEKDSIALLPLISWAQMRLGEPDSAAESLQRCMRWAEAMGARLVIVDALLAQARLQIHLSAWSKARQALDNAFVYAQAMAYPYAEAKAMGLRAVLLRYHGERHEARQAFHASLKLYSALGERFYSRRVATMIEQMDAGDEVIV